MSGADALLRAFRRVTWRGPATPEEVPVSAERDGVLKSRSLLPAVAQTILGAASRWVVRAAPATGGRILTIVDEETVLTPTFARERLGCWAIIYGASHNTAGAFLRANGVVTSTELAASGTGSKALCLPTEAILRRVVVQQRGTANHHEIVVVVGGVDVYSVSRQMEGTTAGFGVGSRSKNWVSKPSTTITAAQGDTIEVRCDTRAHGAITVTLYWETTIGRKGLLYWWGGNVNVANRHMRPIVNGPANSVATDGGAGGAAADERHTAIAALTAGGDTGSNVLVGYVCDTAVATTVITVTAAWGAPTFSPALTSNVEVLTGGVGTNLGRGDPIDIDVVTLAATPGNIGIWIYMPFNSDVRDGCVIPYAGDQTAASDNENLRLNRRPDEASAAANADECWFSPMGNRLGDSDGGMLCDVVGNNASGADTTVWIQQGFQVHRIVVEDPAGISSLEEDLVDYGPLQIVLEEGTWIVLTPVEDNGNTVAWAYIE